MPRTVRLTVRPTRRQNQRRARSCRPKWEARLYDLLVLCVEACSKRALLASLLLGLMVRDSFTRVTVLAYGQELLEEIPAEVADIPDFKERQAAEVAEGGSGGGGEQSLAGEEADITSLTTFRNGVAGPRDSEVVNQWIAILPDPSLWPNDGQTFAQVVHTDGVTVSVLFTRPKPAGPPDELPCMGKQEGAVNPLAHLDADWLGCDPGIRIWRQWPTRSDTPPALWSPCGSAASPGPAQPSPAQPSPAQPSPAQPSPAQPSPAQPSPAQPSPAQPSPAQPSPAQPSPAQPSPAQPSPAQPSPAQPSPAQPSPAQPSPAQPSPAQPSPAQPSPAQPSPAQPSPAQPSPAEPSPTLLSHPALPTEPEHTVLSQVTNYTASLQRYREYAAMTLVTWPAMWAELSKPRWSDARFRLYRYKQSTVAKFWAERGARVRCNSTATGHPLALAYGAAGFSGRAALAAGACPSSRCSGRHASSSQGVWCWCMSSARVSCARTNVVAGQAESFRTASDYAHIATARNRRRSKVACSATLDLQPAALPKSCICVSVTATTVKSFIHEIEEVERAGADIVELRLDYIKDFDTERDLARIMASCSRPYIVTFRPQWEGGQYTGPEPPRLATLKLAALRGAPHVDVEFKAAPLFFASKSAREGWPARECWSQRGRQPGCVAGLPAGRGEVPVSCKVILSSHNFAATPSGPQLQQLAADMHAAGADIVKIATMAQDISDTATVLALLDNPPVPTIALAMGERGLLTRILAAKYGAYLTFAALAPGRESAPGQPNLQQLRQLFNFQAQQRNTKLFGIIGNPVSHSRSPLIHNTAFQHCGFDGVYVPLLVDNLPRFLAAFEHHTDFQGFSVTIPHKVAGVAGFAGSAGSALQLVWLAGWLGVSGGERAYCVVWLQEPALQVCQEVDPVAAQIGAVNTLVRLAGGGFKGYNTDWLAAIEAIEQQLAAGSPPHPEQPHQPPPSPSAPSSPLPSSPPPSSSSPSAVASPLQHKTVLVLGAGGAGRALAFGAASRWVGVTSPCRAMRCCWLDSGKGRGGGGVSAGA
ncbi:hypothetical protein QJQ45_020935 [Haematococcus lacustris]|nr:hypothetical protein QJQ45_020935 [Haematococcus lacustris]